MNTCVLENEISLESDAASHGIPAVDNVDTTSPGFLLPGLTSINNSSKKTKSADSFPSSIKKNYEWDIEEKFSER